MEADPDTFDVLEFEEDVETGVTVLEADPAAAKAALTSALNLWFGNAYGGVDHPELDAEIRRLAEMRVSAIETRIEADLSLGRASGLVAELESLVREHPLRERFWGQLMLALYRSGRQAESLRAFQMARSHLVDQLGIEPGGDLQILEERILEHDPSLLLTIEKDPAVGAERSRRQIRGYELRERIGSGDHGVVHTAYQPSMGREVAIKVIQASNSNDVEFVARFELEAQRVANLEHPHVLQIYDYWRDPSGAYLVMPLMRGGSLADSLQQGGWNLEPAFRLLDQVGDALSHAHRRGIVHGDLKTSNVLLDEDGNAYLSDFGIANLHEGYSELLLATDQESPSEQVNQAEMTYRTDTFALGALLFEVLTGVPAEPNTSATDLGEARQDLPEEVAHTIAKAIADDPMERYIRVEDFLRDMRRSAGVDVVPASAVIEADADPIRNPYKGLRAFAEGDAIDFHGREALIDDMIERIATNRLVTVVGPSGSGKSSVVRAGLIPALRAGSLADSREWLVTDMFPGSYPFEELEAALNRVAAGAPGPMLGELAQPNGLLRVSKQILPGDDSTLLVVIDQFEELFSTVRSEETRRLFLDNLIAVASDERSRVRVVTTIRADFLDRPLDYAEFAEAIAEGIVTVGPPTRDGLAQAVSAPARTVGLDLEPGLVGRIIGDVEGQPGVLPLLQYALTEMFAQRESSTLTIAGYEATGGVAGALGRRAEELYDDLTPSGRTASREVFLRLVSVDELGAVTRRRARQSELVSLAVDRSGLESVLNAFSAFRLLTFDRDPVTRGPTVEVAHEALLTEWPRLHGWIEEARDSLVLARRVGEAAHEWIESSEDTSYLLRGVRLEDVEAWASAADVVLTGDESRYIAASIAQREADRSSARRRRRRTLTALTVGLVMVSVSAVIAFLLWGVAREEALQARVRELAAASEGQLDENVELALLIAAEAFDMSIGGGAQPNPEAVSAMAQGMADWRLVSRFRAGPILYPLASPDGSLIAMADKERLRDVNVFDSSGTLVVTLPGPTGEGVTAHDVAFHPNGETMAVTYSATSDDQFHSVPEGVPDIVVFDTRSAMPVLQLDTEESWNRVAYSPDGTRLIVSISDTVQILDSGNGAEVSSFVAPAEVGSSRFLDSDEMLVPIENSGFSTISVVDGSVIDHIEVAELNPDITSLNSERTHVAYRAGEHLGVLELATGEVVFDHIEPTALTVALDPDATRIAFAGFDPNIHVLPVGSSEQELELAGTFENVYSVAFVDESSLLSFGEDALLWNVAREGMSELGGIPLQEPQWGYQISPDEHLLFYSVSTNVGGSLGDPVDGFRIVDLVTGEEHVISQGEYNSVEAGLRLVSPDFTMVGSLTQDGESSMRSLPEWELLKELDDCRGALAATPDGTRVVLSGWSCAASGTPDSAYASIVDLESGEEIVALPYQRLWSAEFNPAGVFEGGKYLAATDQVSVGIWDVENGTMLGSFDREAFDEIGVLLVISWDPTGRYLVGGTTGGVVWAADLERMVAGESMLDALVFNRQAHTGAAPVPAISSDGLVATAGFDGIVRLWELETERLIYEFISDSGVPVVRFSPDGNEILYPDGLSIRRLPVDPFELRALAGELLTRDFLPDECARYRSTDECKTLSG